ncbi:MAG: endolytic transglycosylase MltG [Clostridia bacterium]|nr:endolytic transglycosylase MltG [Clostridia bacterium]
MNNDNFPEIPKKSDKKFEVHIDDNDYMSPSDLDNITPPVKKKFEVHIDDYETPQTETPISDHRPLYKGEIYFSNRRPVKPEPPVQKSWNDEQSSTASKTKKKASRGSFDFKKAMQNGLIIFCSVVLIFTTAFSAFGISCVNDVLALNRSEEKVKVTIPQNATTDDILDILDDNGLIHNKLFCKAYYELFSWFKNINKSKKPGPPVYLSGVYYVERNLGLEGFLNRFKVSKKDSDTVWLVFPEGWTIYQIIDKIDKFEVCSKEEMLSAISEADFEFDFIKEIGTKPNRTFTLEGYLYPDTYEFYEKSDANSVIRKLLQGSENKWTDEFEQRRAELGMTRDEVLTIASIIQREAANSDQMGKISAVIHNRYNKPASWPTIGCDSTKNYINNFIASRVSPSDAIAFRNAYDTYSIQGLPPGPICNPGEDAIKAALWPDEDFGDYYYFRHDKNGKIYMAKTQAEHDANGNKVLKVNSQY